jgi:hypothetical protein
VLKKLIGILACTAILLDTDEQKNTVIEKGLSMNKTTVLFFLLLFLPQANPATASSRDSDADGIADQLEQDLLIKFLPRFMVSAYECDGLPAEFQPGIDEPRLQAKNGTIYGQVFKSASYGRPGVFLEIHYYHLWGADCGRTGHALDAEHVSALVFAAHAEDPAESWKALYWYAAAHEDTSCDASHGARAADIGAELSGPAIWISAGKHASFLSPETCRGGCGGDNCNGAQALAPLKIVNLGEPGFPMNGALWSGSSKWSLKGKMQTDFPEEILVSIDSAEKAGIMPLNRSKATIKVAAHAGVSTANALSTADQKTDAALITSSDATGRALNKTQAGVGRFLKRAWSGVVGFFK